MPNFERDNLKEVIKMKENQRDLMRKTEKEMKEIVKEISLGCDAFGVCVVQGMFRVTCVFVRNFINSKIFRC